MGRFIAMGERKFRLCLMLLAAIVICAAGRYMAEADPAAASSQDKQAAGLERVLRTGAGLQYGLSEARGFLCRAADGTWAERNQGLPQKTIYPFAQSKPRPLSAFAFDPAKPERVAAATGSALFLSEDAGLNWRKLADSNVFRPNTYLTAVALSPFDKGTLMVGTSFDGIFESRDLGKTWKSISEAMKKLYWGAGFWEEIAALAYDPADAGRLVFACGFGKGLYAYQRKTGKLEDLRLPGLAGNEAVDRLQYYREQPQGEAAGEGAWCLQLGAGRALWSFPPGAAEPRAELEPAPADNAAAPRPTLAVAANKLGLYLTPGHARGASLDKHLAFMKKNGLNALVIDFKDDFGYLTYNTALAEPKRMRAVHPLVHLQDLLGKAKQNGVYVIARLVTFKDQQLFNDQKYKYACWNKYTNQPWRNMVKADDPKAKGLVQKEYWVDPYSREVWEYNLAVAKELQEAGVDEIQFDYIRFPTDGPTGSIRFRYRQEGMEKIDALESFLAMAREQLQIPISTDLYGFSCWCRVEAWTGQNLEVFSRYVDAVCPMFYPSHFPSGFAKGGSYFDRAKLIYSEGTARAYAIGGGRTLIRPYVQAFLLGGERKFTAPSYSAYLQSQLDGLRAAPSSGFLLWNQSNNYYMVTKPVGE